MQSRINTVAFNGLEILNVDLQVQIASGLPAFTIVGLPDKAGIGTQPSCQTHHH